MYLYFALLSSFTASLVLCHPTAYRITPPSDPHCCLLHGVTVMVCGIQSEGAALHLQYNGIYSLS